MAKAATEEAMTARLETGEKEWAEKEKSEEWKEEAKKAAEAPEAAKAGDGAAAADATGVEGENSAPQEADDAAPKSAEEIREMMKVGDPIAHGRTERQRPCLASLAHKVLHVATTIADAAPRSPLHASPPLLSLSLSLSSLSLSLL